MTSLKHKANIAIAHINVKRTITDETIHKIREMLQRGVTHKKICNELCIARHLPSEVKNGSLKPISEITIDGLIEKAAKKAYVKRVRKVMTNEERCAVDLVTHGTCRRKFQPTDAMKLLSYVIENKFIIPITIEKHSLELFGVQFSSTQIKSIINGNTPLYESDFPCSEFTFEDYKELHRVAQDSSVKFWPEGTKVAKALKIRKIDASSIIAVLVKKRGDPGLTYKQIGKSMDLSEGQVRNCLIGLTKVFIQEFPVNGISWEQYKEMTV